MCSTPVGVSFALNHALGVIHSTYTTRSLYNAHLKVKGVAKLSGGVNMVSVESLPVISVLFPVGVSSQVQPVTEFA